MLFANEAHGLPVAWFLRLKDALQPLFLTGKVDAVHVVYASTSMLDLGKQLLQHLGLVNLKPKMSPLRRLFFHQSAASLAAALPDATSGLPESTWAVEHSLARRWPVTLLDRKGRAVHGSTLAPSSSSHSAVAFASSSFLGRSKADTTSAHSTAQSALCITDTFLLVERTQRFHAVHPSVPSVDFYPLAHFHDVALDYHNTISAAAAVAAVRSGGSAASVRGSKGFSESGAAAAAKDGLLPIVAVTSLDQGSLVCIQFRALAYRDIVAALRLAASRCRQDATDLQAQGDLLLGGTRGDILSEEAWANNRSHTSALSELNSQAPTAAVVTPSVADPGNENYVSSSSSRSSSAATVPTSRNQPAIHTTTTTTTPAVFASGAAAAVSPGELFGSLVHLSLLHLSSASLTTRQRAWALLHRVRSAFGLLNHSQRQQHQFLPLALPALTAAAPSTRALSLELAAAAPQYTLAVLACALRWLRKQTTASGGNISSNGITSFSSSNSNAPLVAAVLDYSSPWMANLAHPFAHPYGGGVGNDYDPSVIFAPLTAAAVASKSSENDKKVKARSSRHKRRSEHRWGFFSFADQGHLARQLGPARQAALDVLLALGKLTAASEGASSGASNDYFRIVWQKTVGSSPDLAQAALLSLGHLAWQHETRAMGVAQNTSASSSIPVGVRLGGHGTVVGSAQFYPTGGTAAAAATAAPAVSTKGDPLMTTASTSDGTSTDQEMRAFPHLNTGSKAPFSAYGGRLQSTEGEILHELLLGRPATSSSSSSSSGLLPPPPLPPPPSMKSTSLGGAAGARLAEQIRATASEASDKSISWRGGGTSATTAHAGGAYTVFNLPSNASLMGVATAAVSASHMPANAWSATASAEVRKFLDVCAIVGAEQPSVVVGALVRELSHAADSLGSACNATRLNTISSNDNRGDGTSSNRADNSGTQSSVGGSSAPRDGLGVPHTGRLIMSSKEGAAGEWARVMVTFRALKSLKSLCSMLVKRRFLPRLLHALALLVNRGPPELRASLFPFVCNLVDALATSLAASAAEAEDNWTTSVSEIMDRSLNEDEEQSIAADKAKTRDDRRQQRRLKKQLSTAQARVDGLVAIMGNPAAAQSFCGKEISQSSDTLNQLDSATVAGRGRSTSQSSNNTKQKNDSDSQQDFGNQPGPHVAPWPASWPAAAAEADAAGSAENSEWVLTEKMELPLYVLFELGECATLVSQCRSSAVSSQNSSDAAWDNDDDNSSSSSDDDDEIDHESIAGAGVGEFAPSVSKQSNSAPLSWAIAWLKRAEATIARAPLSTNAARAFCVVVRLAQAMQQDERSSRHTESGAAPATDARSGVTVHKTDSLDTAFVLTMTSLSAGMRQVAHLSSQAPLRLTSTPTLSALAHGIYAYRCLYMERCALDRTLVISTKSSRGDDDNEAAAAVAAAAPAAAANITLDPGALFWPAVLLCAAADPSSEAFVHAAKLLLAALQHASALQQVQDETQSEGDSAVETQTKEDSTQNENESASKSILNGQWSVERALLAYRNRHEDVDAAVTILEQVAQVNFSGNFAAALSAVLLRALPYNHARPLPSVAAANRGHQMPTKHSSRSIWAELQLPTAASTVAPRTAALAVLEFCAYDSLIAWSTAVIARRSTTTATPKNQEAPTAASVFTSSFSSTTGTAEAKPPALPAYMVVLASVRGLDWVEELIENSLAALEPPSVGQADSMRASRLQRQSSNVPFTFHRSSTADDDDEEGGDRGGDSMYASAGAASAVNGKENLEAVKDDEDDEGEEDEEDDDDEEWGLFSQRYFPDLQSQTLALALLFTTYFQGGTVSSESNGEGRCFQAVSPRDGEVEDVELLQALRIGCEAMPAAFDALRSRVLPRLQACLLDCSSKRTGHRRGAVAGKGGGANGGGYSTSPLVSSGNGIALREALGEILALAFEADDVKAAAASEAEAQKAAKAVQAASAVMNLDDRGDLSPVPEMPDDLQNDDGGGGNADNGVGPWGGVDGNGIGDSSRNYNERKSSSAATPVSVLMECGFGHLARLRGPSQDTNGDSDNSDDDDNNDNDDDVDEGGDTYGGYEGRNNGRSHYRGGLRSRGSSAVMMMRRAAREQVCVLAADLFGTAADTARKRIAAKAYIVAELEAEAKAAEAAQAAAEAAAAAAEAAASATARTFSPGTSTSSSNSSASFSSRSSDILGRSRGSSDADKQQRQRGPTSRPSSSSSSSHLRAATKRLPGGVTSPVTSPELSPPSASTTLASSMSPLSPQYGSDSTTPGASAAAGAGRRSGGGHASGHESGSTTASSTAGTATSPRAGRRGSSSGAPLSVRTRNSPAEKAMPSSPRATRHSPHN